MTSFNFQPRLSASCTPLFAPRAPNGTRHAPNRPRNSTRAVTKLIHALASKRVDRSPIPVRIRHPVRERPTREITRSGLLSTGSASHPTDLRYATRCPAVDARTRLIRMKRGSNRTALGGSRLSYAHSDGEAILDVRPWVSKHQRAHGTGAPSAELVTGAAGCTDRQASRSAATRIHSDCAIPVTCCASGHRAKATRRTVRQIPFDVNTAAD